MTPPPPLPFHCFLLIFRHDNSEKNIHNRSTYVNNTKRNKIAHVNFRLIREKDGFLLLHPFFGISSLVVVIGWIRVAAPKTGSVQEKDSTEWCHKNEQEEYR